MMWPSLVFMYLDRTNFFRVAKGVTGSLAAASAWAVSVSISSGTLGGSHCAVWL